MEGKTAIKAAFWNERRNIIFCSGWSLCCVSLYANIRNLSSYFNEIIRNQTRPAAKLKNGFQWLNANASITVDLDLNDKNTAMFLELLYFTWVSPHLRLSRLRTDCHATGISCGLTLVFEYGTLLLYFYEFITSRKCDRGNAFGRTCLSVCVCACSVRAQTFETIDLESLFLMRRYISNKPVLLQLYLII